MFEQERFIVRLRQRILEDRTIEGCWLGGSFGRNGADGYSDVDITLLFSDDASRDHAWKTRQTFCQSLLVYVPAKSMDIKETPYHHVTLYSNGTLADFFYASRETVQPNARYGQIKILKDTADQWVAQFQQRCVFLSPLAPSISAEQLRQIDDQFWIDFWDVYRHLLRGNPEKSFASYLQLMANSLPPLLALLPTDHTAYRNLVNLHYSLNVPTTIAHCKALFQNYRAARTAIVERLKLSYTADQAFERSLEKAMGR